MSIDPMAAGQVVGWLMQWLTAYVGYKVARQEVAPAAPATKPVEVAKGEQVAALVKAHGDAAEQADLQRYEENPKRYAGAVEDILGTLLASSPTFREQVKALVEREGSPDQRVQVRQVFHNSKIGVNVAHNAGTMTIGPIHLGDDVAGDKIQAGNIINSSGVVIGRDSQASVNTARPDDKE